MGPLPISLGLRYRMLITILFSTSSVAYIPIVYYTHIIVETRAKPIGTLTNRIYFVRIQMCGLLHF